MTEPINPFGVFPSIPLGSTAPPMPRPDDLDVVALTNANGNQLNYWIDATNKGLAKKVLIKTGTVDVRRQRLADYFGIDLSAVPDTPTVGPITRDIAINQMQWAHLRTLGDEWAAKDSAGAVFRLVPDNAATSITHRTSVKFYYYLCIYS